MIQFSGSPGLIPDLPRALLDPGVPWGGRKLLIKSNKFNRKKVLTFSPQMVYQKQGPHSELNLGMYVTKKNITGGIWYRDHDAFIFVLGLKNNNFNFGFSYDATLSRLKNNTAGSIELSIAYVFSCKNKRKRIKILPCPSF